MEILRKKQPTAQIIELEIEPTKKKKTNYQKTKDEINQGSWCEENKQLHDVFYYTSYFAAAISLSSAYYWVVSAIGTFFTGAIISKLFGGGALGLLEYFDRLTSKRFWKDWFFYRTIHKPCLILALVILGGSLWLSVDGEQEAKESAKASPQTIATNTLLEAKQAEKDSIQTVYTNITDSPSSYKFPKTMTTMWWPTQQAQEKRNDAILALSEEIKEIQKEIKGENHLLTNTHIEKVEKIGNVFLVLVFVFAIYYQFCIGWLAYYKRQEYNEEELKVQLTALHSQGVKITPTLAMEVLEEIKKPIKRKMRFELNF